MSEKLADYKFKVPVAIRFSDIDTLGHVNNAVYLTYFELARLHYWRDIMNWNLRDNGVIVGRSEINYLKPLTLEDEISCYIRTTRIGNSSFDVMHILVKKTLNGEEICTTGKTVCISYDYALNRSVPIPENEKQKMIAFDAPKMILNTN